MYCTASGLPMESRKKKKKTKEKQPLVLFELEVFAIVLANRSCKVKQYGWQIHIYHVLVTQTCCKQGAWRSFFLHLPESLFVYFHF